MQFAKKLTVLLLMLALGSVPAFAENIAVNGDSFSPRIFNHYVHLPVGYDANNSQGYPLLIFFHGRGEAGDANNSDGTLNTSVLSRVLRHGPPMLIHNRRWDETLPFIVLSPQSERSDGGFYSNDFINLYNFAVNQYNVDPNRVYITGLSQGGGSVYNFILQRPDLIAAAIPVAAWTSAQSFDCNAIRHIALWGFHGDLDTTVAYSSGRNAVERFNRCDLNHPARFTAYAGVGHDSWARTYDNSMGNAYNPFGSESATADTGGDGIYYDRNIYRWLLSHSLIPVATTVNQVPVVNAGADQSVSVSDGGFTLTGGATDADGYVQSVAWSQISGPTQVGSSSDLLWYIPNPSVGTYQFRLTATDNRNASVADDVTIVVRELENRPVPEGEHVVFNVTNAWSYAHLRYHHALGNTSAARVNVFAMGHNRMELLIRHVSGSLDYSRVTVGGYVGWSQASVPVANYIQPLSDSWSLISIPLSDFNLSSVQTSSGFYTVTIGTGSGVGNGQFAIDEIRFVGGASPLVWYGDDYEASAGAGLSVQGTGLSLVP